MTGIIGILLAQGVSTPAGSQTTTWNPSDKSSNGVLTNGNCTITVGGMDAAGARSTTSLTAGKRYAEFLLDNFGGGFGEGVGFGVANVFGTFGSSGSVGVDLESSGGTWFDDGSYDSIKSNMHATIEDTSMLPISSCASIAVDFDAGKIWIGADGSFPGDPAAGTGENFSFTPNSEQFLMGSVSEGGLSGTLVTLNTANSPPSGFLEWDA